MFKKLKDKRYTAYQRKARTLTASILLGVIAGMILYASFLSVLSDKPLLNPKGTSLEAPTPTVTPTPPECTDPLCYIRQKGQKEGYDDYTISKFIRLARVESGFNLNPLAKNPTSSATGVFQFINGTFHHYCKGKNVYDYKDNIDCFFTVLEEDGYPNALSHWSTSLAKAGIK